MSSKRSIALFAILLLPVLDTSGLQPKKAPNPQVAVWQALMPSVESVLKEQGIVCDVRPWTLSIVDAADFPSADISVAFIDYCAGGAYSDSIITMQLEQGKPVVANFRQRDGKLGHGDFI